MCQWETLQWTWSRWSSRSSSLSNSHSQTKHFIFRPSACNIHHQSTVCHPFYRNNHRVPTWGTSRPFYFKIVILFAYFSAFRVFACKVPWESVRWFSCGSIFWNVCLENFSKLRLKKDCDRALDSPKKLASWKWHATTRFSQGRCPVSSHTKDLDCRVSPKRKTDARLAKGLVIQLKYLRRRCWSSREDGVAEQKDCNQRNCDRT